LVGKTKLMSHILKDRYLCRCQYSENRKYRSLTTKYWKHWKSVWFYW